MQIPGGGKSNKKMKSPRDLYPNNTFRSSPKASDHARASEKTKEAIAEMNADARKSAREKK